MYRKIYALQAAESDIYHSKCQMSRNFATVKAGVTYCGGGGGFGG
jgi:hypothetical protein